MTHVASNYMGFLSKISAFSNSLLLFVINNVLFKLHFIVISASHYLWNFKCAELSKMSTVLLQ